MSLYERIFGVSARAFAKAKAAEVRGDLAEAIALFVKAGHMEEAARLAILRGDRETGHAARMRHYGQAIAMAPNGSSARVQAGAKRARAVVAMAAEAPLTRALRLELIRSARELEAAGQYEGAAEAYARAEDVEGQARALVNAGAVEALDAVLAGDLARDRNARSLRDAHEEFLSLVAAGDRRRAVALARARDDETLRARALAVERRRVTGAIVRAKILGVERVVLLGDEVLIGRAPDVDSADVGRAFVGLALPSAVLSRSHVAIARRGADIYVRDLGSRNGTKCGDRMLVGEKRVDERLELWLGGDVHMILRTSGPLPGSLAIDVGRTSYVAPLRAAASLGIGRWQLEVGADRWVELATEDAPPAFGSALQLGARVTLLGGDALATTRGGTPQLVMHAAAPDDEAEGAC